MLQLNNKVTEEKMKSKFFFVLVGVTILLTAALLLLAAIHNRSLVLAPGTIARFP
jgi:hypothetical protein